MTRLLIHSSNSAAGPRTLDQVGPSLSHSDLGRGQEHHCGWALAVLGGKGHAVESQVPGGTPTRLGTQRKEENAQGHGR